MVARAKAGGIRDPVEFFRRIYLTERAARAARSSVRRVGRDGNASPCVEGRTDHAPAAAQASRWGSIIPAAWSFMLAARAQGLGTVWTTFHLRHEREAAEVLGIPFQR
jgi:nitroreductase